MFNLSRKPVLSPNAKNLIRHQDHYYTKVLIDSKGEPVNKEFEKVISPYEIRKELFGKIKKLGFKLQIVPPNKANCIIRVYQKSYFQENGKAFTGFGGNCYTKMSFDKSWKTYAYGGYEQYDPYECVKGICVGKDTFQDVKFDFFDTFVKVY